MTDPRSFGAWLARERERRGITIRAVADRTKIGARHLEALERGDVSRWPAGIYRHGFVKAYAGVVGLDADLVVANFERAFPDPDAPAPLLPPGAPGELRLVLEPPRVLAGVPAAAWRRAGLAVAFAAAAGVIGFLVAGLTGFWCGTAVAALASHVSSVLGLTARGAAARWWFVLRAWSSVLTVGAPKHEAPGTKHQAFQSTVRP